MQLIVTILCSQQLWVFVVHEATFNIIFVIKEERIIKHFF